MKISTDYRGYVHYIDLDTILEVKDGGTSKLSIEVFNIHLFEGIVTDSYNKTIYTYDDYLLMPDTTYVSWRELVDYLKPSSSGDMSSIEIMLGNCGEHRYRYLMTISFKQPMGKGTKKKMTISPRWYPGISYSLDLNSTRGMILNYACKYLD